MRQDAGRPRALCGALIAIMTGTSYATSAEMAKELGPFPDYKKNAAHMLRVIRNHRRAAQAKRSAVLRASAACSAAARTDAPQIASRDLVPITHQSRAPSLAQIALRLVVGR